MASANQTLRDCGIEFEVDGTERTHTLVTPGGYIKNNGAVDIVINTLGAAIAGVAQPVGEAHVYIKAGDEVPLPVNCSAIRAKSTGAASYASYRKGFIQH